VSATTYHQPPTTTTTTTTTTTNHSPPTTTDNLCTTLNTIVQLPGAVTTAFAGLHPPFHFPRGISIDASGAFVVGERHRIQRVGNPEYHFAWDWLIISQEGTY
jgi:hypothetical protein